MTESQGLSESSSTAPAPSTTAGAAPHLHAWKNAKRSERRGRMRMSWLKRTLALLFVGAGLGLLIWAFLPKPVLIETGSILRGDLRVTIDEDGRTRVKDRYLVSSPLLANLARVELSAGDAVEPDTVVARLLPLAPALLDTRTRAEAEQRVAASSAAERQTHASMARIQTSLDFATHELARLRGLHAQAAAADRAVEQAELEERSLREELRSAEFGAKVADHELLLARAAIGLLGGSYKSDAEPLLVRSPVRGRVLRVLQQSEGVVQPGTPLVELGDPAALEVVVDVLTADAVHVRPGTRALIERWGGDATLAAHVRTIEPSAFTRMSALGVEEQRVNVVLDLDSPRQDWAALGDGYRVESRLIVWEGRNLLTAPASAVFNHKHGFALFRVEAERARLTPIKVGHRNDERVELLDAVPEQSVVVLHPSDRVIEGVRVSTR